MTINKIEASDGFLVWHFVRVVNGEFTTGEENLPVVPGQALRVEGEIIPCVHGLHGSERALDALQFAPGAGVERALLRGTIIAHGGNKHVASERLCLWVADATRVLHEFMLWCAEEALALVDNPDPRSVAVLATKRRWLDGDATDAELEAACVNAYDAAVTAAATAADYDTAADYATDTATVVADFAAADFAADHAAADALATAAADALAAAAVATFAAAHAATFAANGVYSATRDRQNAQLETLLMTLAPQEHKS